MTNKSYQAVIHVARQTPFSYQATQELKVPVGSRWQTFGSMPGICIVSRQSTFAEDAIAKVKMEAERILKEIESDSQVVSVTLTPLPPAPAWITGEYI